MNLSPPIFVQGYGAVSAAGTSAADLYDAAKNQRKLPTSILQQTFADDSPPIDYDVRCVDRSLLKKVIPKHSRLRRSSAVTKYAVVAAQEALGAERIAEIQAGEKRIGIVLSLLNGCVNYSNRFYTELLDDPSLASPIIFPETVFNAPASHVAAFLGVRGPTYSIIGDTAAWFSALQIASGWIEDQRVDGCLVVCAEELDWLTTAGLEMHSQELTATEGAAAVYLDSSLGNLQLTAINGPFPYQTIAERSEAINLAANSITSGNNQLLVDGLTGSAKIDRLETQALEAWQGDRISPMTTIGSAMGANGGLQMVAALEGLKQGYESAVVMASGSNQHAFSTQLDKISS